MAEVTIGVRNQASADPPTGSQDSTNSALSVAGNGVPRSSSIPNGTLLIYTYRIERLLGSGGMGEVYLARHSELGTRHAVKVIRPALFSNQQVLGLFRREASVLRGVRHDAVVSYDGFFRDEHGRNYLVMEYVEGPSLAERLKRGPLSVDEVFVLRDRVGAGLAVAHAKGAVHRDVSPDNVILPDGQLEKAKLIDFGLCKLTDPSSQTIIGSSFGGKYRYASPEQVGLFGGAVDARSDIYSLGLVMVAAARGRPLEMGNSFDSVCRARRIVPDLSSVPPVLREQIDAMLQPNPGDRPQSLGELIRRWPAPPVLEAQTTRIPDPRAVAERPGRIASGRSASTRWPVWLTIGMMGLALTGAGIYWLFQTKMRGTVEPKIDKTEVVRDSGPPLTLPRIAELPWDEIESYFAEYVRRGHTDQAFALLQEAVRKGHVLPPQQTYAFAQQLLTLGHTDEAFALFRHLGAKGHAPSALALGEMYDPRLWSKARSPFSQANARQAEKWYQRALTQGSVSARVRLKELAQWQQKHDDQGDGGH